MTPSLPKVLSDEFTVTRTLGEGSFSRVKLAVNKKTGEHVAIKIMIKSKMPFFEKTTVHRKSILGTATASAAAAVASAASHSLRLLRRRSSSRDDGDLPNGNTSCGTNINNEHEEDGSASFGNLMNVLGKDARLLQLLDHPNVVKLYQVIETSSEVYVVMQYAPGGELVDFLAQSGGILSELICRKFIRQVVSALDHCHESGVVHRDLKVQNILLIDRDNILISDFGLGRDIQDGGMCNTHCGTPLYAAPELLRKNQVYDATLADVWALGVVIFIMMNGLPPFRLGDSPNVFGAKDMRKLYNKIMHLDYVIPHHFSKSLGDLIDRIFVSPHDRITVDEIRNHAWLSEGYPGPPERIPRRASSANVLTDGYRRPRFRSLSRQDGVMIYQFRDMGNANNYSSATYKPNQEHRDLSPEAAGTNSQSMIPRSLLGRVFGSSFSLRSQQEGEPISLKNGDRKHGSFNTEKGHSGGVQGRTRRGTWSSTRRTTLSTSPDRVAAEQALIVLPELSTTSDKRTMKTMSRTESMPVFKYGCTEVDIDSSIIAVRSDSPTRKHDSEKVCSVRGLFRLVASTSSSVETLVARLLVVLRTLNLPSTMTSAFTIVITYTTPTSRVILEVEVCKVWLLPINGLRIMRMSGDPFVYHALYKAIVNGMATASNNEAPKT